VRAACRNGPLAVHLLVVIITTYSCSSTESRTYKNFNRPTNNTVHMLDILLDRVKNSLFITTFIHNRIVASSNKTTGSSSAQFYLRARDTNNDMQIGYCAYSTPCSAIAILHRQSRAEYWQHAHKQCNVYTQPPGVAVQAASYSVS